MVPLQSIADSSTGPSHSGWFGFDQREAQIFVDYLALPIFNTFIYLFRYSFTKAWIRIYQLKMSWFVQIECKMLYVRCIVQSKCEVWQAKRSKKSKLVKMCHSNSLELYMFWFVLNRKHVFRCVVRWLTVWKTHWPRKIRSENRSLLLNALINKLYTNYAIIIISLYNSTPPP